MANKNENLPAVPCSPEAERAVLGAILLSGGALYPAAAAILSAEDFFAESNRTIFRAMGRVAGQIDLVTLMEILMADLNIDAVGGAGYLSSLTDGLPRQDNLDHYAQIIFDHHRRRRIASAAQVIGQEALDCSIQPEDAAARGTRLLLDLETRPQDGLQKFDRILQSQLASIDDIGSPNQQQGIPTGYARIDELTHGLQRGEMGLIAARPSVGKTALALNIAVNVSKSTGPVGIFSLEMTKRALMMRMICSEARVSWHKWAGGFLNHEETGRMVHAAGTLANQPLYVDDDSSVHPEVMLARALKLKAAVGELSLMVVDYVQLIQAGGRQESRVQEMSYVSRFLKRMGKELNCPMLVCCQLNRSPEEGNRAPRLSDLKDTGQLEQDADLVLFLWRGERARRGKAEAILSGDSGNGNSGSSQDGTVNVTIGKQRNGPVGEFKLAFIGPYCRFEKLAEGFDE